MDGCRTVSINVYIKQQGKKIKTKIPTNLFMNILVGMDLRHQISTTYVMLKAQHLLSLYQKKDIYLVATVSFHGNPLNHSNLTLKDSSSLSRIPTTSLLQCILAILTEQYQFGIIHHLVLHLDQDVTSLLKAIQTRTRKVTQIFPQAT